MANKLPSGRWRGRVVNLKGKQVAPHTIIGGTKTYATKRQAERAEDQARDVLLGQAERGVTLREFWTEWTTSPLWARSSESTNLHNLERTTHFVERYGERPIAAIDSTVVAEWLKGGKNVGTVNSLRTLFNDARRPQAGMLVEHNPFANLGLRSTHGRKHLQPPDQVGVARVLAAADELTPPSFAAWLLTGCYEGMRPGELDGLQWTDLDFQARTVDVRRQWNAKLCKLALPKGNKTRKIAMTEPVYERLLRLPRESKYVFTTVRGNHYTPSTRAFHWNRVRVTVGGGNTELYLCTRHHFAWYALNVLELPPHQIALQLGHTDGGILVRQTYGHPDAAIARERIREAFEQVAPVAALRAAVGVS
jgi:integrase